MPIRHDWQHVYDAKRAFVRDLLAPMLVAATRGTVTSADYEGDVSGEHVYLGVRGEDAPVAVNVGCDSEWAIVKDVMRAVARYM